MRSSGRTLGTSSSIRSAERPSLRRGSVLVVVLVVVLLLTFGAYRFTDVMIFEANATAMYEREVHSRLFADSGIEWAAALLLEPPEETTAINFYDNPQYFRGILLHDAPNPRGRGRFSIIAPREQDQTGRSLRFGLVDESSKLNLNAILEFDLDEEGRRDMLLALPEMTIEIADAILDWLDEDEQPRQFGAENEYYGTLDPPYEAKNARLESLDELLRVRGVTRWLLYGEDVNRNGLLDPSENDGELSLPIDNADGVLQRGWSVDLTARSREANIRNDGNPRIDVNQQDLANLYDTLRAEFDEETARFVTAYRLFGPADNGDPGSGSSDSAGRGRESGSSAQAGGGPGGQRPSSGNSGGQRGASVERGGLDLSSGGQQPVNSLYDLIGVNVRAEINGEQRELQSPWDDDPTGLRDVLPKLLDTLTTTSAGYLEGRINIGQAPREVLLSIPGIDEQLVETIVGAQRTSAAAEEIDPLRTTSGWLLAEGLVELEQMRSLDRYLTGRGDVYRVQVVGFFDAGGPATRLEAVIDATQVPPRIVAVRDLTALGWGYSVQQLLQTTGGN